MNSGTKVVKLKDGTIVDKPWSTWTFITVDGERITGKFTDEEIEIMKLEPREIKWNE